jgi:hypothetical protein
VVAEMTQQKPRAWDAAGNPIAWWTDEFQEKRMHHPAELATLGSVATPVAAHSATRGWANLPDVRTPAKQQDVWHKYENYMSLCGLWCLLRHPVGGYLVSDEVRQNNCHVCFLKARYVTKYAARKRGAQA